MVPFVRTLREAEQVIALLARHGLKRGHESVKGTKNASFVYFSIND
jgi:hypothetical protein